ncbi:hypothetical protein [Clostridium botulinum]|uniref:hypothetical protein n=1 Tax=Clostridium botulinum TaxID=1491 RepID=UPI000D386AB0|nr:hypothetical protein [Clostridium botulinum]AWB30059.1 hypothetical protein DBN47_07245 [Clostridium botulinum]MBY6830675.1 hypothetical protein [Clostridium botulinum]MBY6940399.1 hypothetical protein [Clostridium botulinum]MBY6961202.1 hypothetical protein [Clostridium botulinum]MCR1172876.1 hypothetical protein [Clostridium botulinum]
MQYIGIKKFGVFVINNTIPKVPDNPWFTNNYPGDLSARGNGDIRVYNTGESFYIGNSSLDETRKITWLHIRDGNKHIYISDRVLLTNVSWNILNAEHMIEGKTVIIDGIEYKLRVLTGGDPQNPNNEWDNIIQNKANIVGLPKPTQGDLTPTNTYEQLDGDNNQHWNWWGVRTICQETSYNRGYTSVLGLVNSNPQDTSMASGWRPVLEFIESTPPEKPTILTPTGTEIKPSVTNIEPIKIETTFNNSGGTFKHMDYEVWDLDLNKRVANTRVFITNDVLTPKLELGHRYKLIVSHTNTADQVSPQATSYFMRGILNKYKLSEPVTQKQYDKLTAYTGGDNLIMKPQTFPETENSKVRLVPQTMNTLTVRGIEGNELEYSATTKELVIGDKLIKDNQTYTISEVIKQTGDYNIDQEITVVKDVNARELFWGYGLGKKSCVYDGRIYAIYKDNKYAYFIGTELDGTDKRTIWMTSSNNLNSTAVIRNGDTIYVVVARGSSVILYAYKAGKGIEKSVLSSSNTNFTHIDAAIDSRNNHLVISTREVITSGDSTSYIMRVYWIDVTNLDSIITKKTYTIASNVSSSAIGLPVVLDIKTSDTYNIKVLYAHKPGVNVGIFEFPCSLLERGEEKSIYMMDAADASSTSVFAQMFTERDGIDTMFVTYRFQDVAGTYKLRSYAIRSNGEKQHNQIASTSNIITQHQVTYSKDQGFIALYAILAGVIYKSSQYNISDKWSSVEAVESFESRGSGFIFECVNLNPISYGKYPGLLVLAQNPSERTDALKFKANFKLDTKSNTIILDKPITTQVGEVIKFLDYDLEIKAGEETATITPTEITNDYYEYDAKFDKKEAERKVIVVGRNSKLTTLYYYNY